MLFRKLIQIWKQGVLSWFFNLYILITNPWFLYFSSSTNVAKKYCKDLSNIQGARRLKMHALEVSIWRWEGVDVLRTTSQYQYGWFFGNLPNIPWPLPFGKICCKFSGKCWHFRFPWFYFVVKCCLKSATQFFGWKMTPPPPHLEDFQKFTHIGTWSRPLIVGVIFAQSGGGGWWIMVWYLVLHTCTVWAGWVEEGLLGFAKCGFWIVDRGEG